MNAESLARLKRNLLAANDEALVAFSNRGLVRRAAKDLESETITVELSDDAALVHGGAWTVRMPPEGPTAATDNTPATGVTRQILTATMYLRDRWLASVTSEASAEHAAESNEHLLDQEIENAILLLSHAPMSELFKWCGKTPLLEAAAGSHAAGAALIVKTPHLKVEFPQAGVSVVLMTNRPAKTPRKLLDQMKSTGGREEHARWVLTAVLAIKKAAGKSIEVDPKKESD